jgi:hypothetical protein
VSTSTVADFLVALALFYSHQSLRKTGVLF